MLFLMIEKPTKLTKEQIEAVKEEHSKAAKRELARDGLTKEQIEEQIEALGRGYKLCWDFMETLDHEEQPGAVTAGFWASLCLLLIKNGFTSEMAKEGIEKQKAADAAMAAITADKTTVKH
jgi:hypothetical protein